MRAVMRWHDGVASEAKREVAEETAIALTYGGSTQAVMMATPCDLEDFAVGFSLTEGIVASAAEIEHMDIVESELGLDIQMQLASPRNAAFVSRRRAMAGPVGCGLCGIESLAEAMRPLPSQAPDGRRVKADVIASALRRLPKAQVLNRATRAVHGAAFATSAGVLTVREDVGRHNALDKLLGALARSGVDPAVGFIMVTSRLSVEMVQKAAIAGAPVLVAVSAPTALAVRSAEAAGMTLVAVAREDGFEVVTHPSRIDFSRLNASAEDSQFDVA
ncbi:MULTISPECIES: formate dehydrogenase accessory sulfurtransferase FdhD [unclassified Chelatococcus]|uniref:formate dehydrogenase accessory sulfurtransferase FdhD n=1 Tax=unclassified Chelatococcus TaxID=2638111 RepID=UPI001BCFE975|nr:MULTISPECIES: formate dehydrogenase accessory sulfurtransferase FdhD [unclassified Chelatococcus]MBS7701062.1 formate dehydrogenase accessory sulfurtransferase FdhD [Chelatococcus sp. YT9]MBX3555595.1 formate dehydrogenase accessory sulfurtransferase FdhD [Chelatococcus sp.]